jgi:hypothetical protein
MDKSVEMKRKVLGMLEDFMMGEHGKRMKPAAIEVEMVTSKPVKGSLKDALDEASEDEDENEYGREPMSEDEGDIDQDGDHDIHDHALEQEAKMYDKSKRGMAPLEDEDEEDKRPKKTSLKDFFARK